MGECLLALLTSKDKVIHTGILIKLLDIGVSSRFYNIIKNMYKQTKSCVKIENKLTHFFESRLGVKQGGNLFPIYLKYS